ncbi:NUDIX hydrolase [Pseudothauera nasutitermitis]|uniref:Phosphatase NudJ n=1 Tax=Pseudothauera nasutitermitis TaxID=2565930 RepID=A0A4S4AR67_9RHOO|nr:NUDIX hydrolase [Pseudothauera nasutitermitis]THF62291.1 NUDIX hydrolase [Pseudothauera nasutitermitis]
MQRNWKPNVTVAAVIERDGRFLLVEEETAEGLRFNQPAGHLEEGESLLAASVRETLEETAHHFMPDCLVGVYQWPRPQGDLTYLRFAFGGRVAGEESGRTLDAGIVRAVWLTPEEMQACADRHRSPLVMQCVDDWLAGRRHALDLIRHYDAA